jgi:hypothetical protein
MAPSGRAWDRALFGLSANGAVSSAIGRRIRPILRASCKTGLHRVFLDIMERVRVVPLIAHEAIEKVGRPDRAGGFPKSIDRFGGIGFLGTDDFAQSKALYLLNYHVDMVRHDHPREQAVAFAVEMLQSVFHDGRNRGLA